MAEIVIELKNLLESYWQSTNPAWSSIKKVLNVTDKSPDYPCITIRRSVGKGSASRQRQISFNMWKYVDRYEIICMAKAVKGETDIGDAKKQRDNMVAETRRIIRENPTYIEGYIIRPQREYVPAVTQREENTVKTTVEIEVVSYKSISES